MNTIEFTYVTKIVHIVGGTLVHLKSLVAWILRFKQIDDIEIINSNRTANAASPALEISSGS
ncbi:uncharacterized protein K444DRAFT_620517 [Hyaloscypha bicolor E]|uniref:Uncharacterized protein n=1 Tax=Hyaloscypha bicolor E TaxID=1095630 RepID=A0A2J6SKV9_9HELO|nr:uncharacterized protein K444DRAFT_620517 [Hyaloscypha bicolor E]PMD51408.1 hypothetical protein K444DRAFT_620517 [Hyaloscypha bicolor E]